MSKIPDENGVIESAVEPVKNRKKYWLNTTTNKMYILNNGTYELMEPEIITNSNGTAIKFPDGTMICYGNVKFTDVNFNKVYGNVFLETAKIRTIEFPATFKDSNYFLNLFPKKFGGGVGGVCGSDCNRNNITYFLWHSDKYDFTNKEIEISFEVIGRWK